MARAERVEVPKPARTRKPRKTENRAGARSTPSSVTPRAAKEALQQQEALQRRAAGGTYQQIADAMGIDKATVYRLINRALDTMYIEGARAIQIMHVERYHRILGTEWDAAMDRQADDHYKAVGVVVTVMRDITHLLNLDKVDASQPAGNDEEIVGRADTVVLGLTKEEYFAALRKAHAARRALEDEALALESTQPLMTDLDEDEDVVEAEIVDES